MVLPEKFSVRPNIRAEEALTSFLLRVCSSNFISIKELFEEIQINYNQADLRNAHHIDINPYITIDSNLLSELTGFKVHLINVSTFNGALCNFIKKGDMHKLNNSSALIKNSFSIKNRKFCPVCLQESVCYKLIWQVKDIVVCPSHNIPLTSNCSECGQNQPFLHMNLAQGICCYCNSYLHTSPKIKASSDSLDYSNWLVTQWNYLIAIQGNLEIIEKDIAVKLLYICSKSKKNFSIEQISLLSRDYIYKLLNIISSESHSNDDFNIGLNVILKVLYQLEIPIWDFLNSKLPKAFSELISAYLNKRIHQNCLTPWCNFINTNKKLLKMNTFRSKTHHSLHLCTSCCLKFGLNIKTQCWEEYGDIINGGYNKVLPLINNGVSKQKISHITGLSRYKIYKMASYFARYKLINDKFLKNYTPQTPIFFSNDDILLIAHRNETIMRNSAKMKLGLGINNFYYFFYDPFIQESLYVRSRSST
ncbi:TniQ family protein [Bacillus sp. JRC01]|nr:TniQ family protein [Bacillus sp. JRC01]